MSKSFFTIASFAIFLNIGLVSFAASGRLAHVEQDLSTRLTGAST